MADKLFISEDGPEICPICLGEERWQFADGDVDSCPVCTDDEPQPVFGSCSGCDKPTKSWVACVVFRWEEGNGMYPVLLNYMLCEECLAKSLQVVIGYVFESFNKDMELSLEEVEWTSAWFEGGESKAVIFHDGAIKALPDPELVLEECPSCLS
jgi:hypothetical protein